MKKERKLHDSCPKVDWWVWYNKQYKYWLVIGTLLMFLMCECCYFIKKDDNFIKIHYLWFWALLCSIFLLENQAYIYVVISSYSIHQFSSQFDETKKYTKSKECGVMLYEICMLTNITEFWYFVTVCLMSENIYFSKPASKCLIITFIIIT